MLFQIIDRFYLLSIVNLYNLLLTASCLLYGENKNYILLYVYTSRTLHYLKLTVIHHYRFKERNLNISIILFALLDKTCVH